MSTDEREQEYLAFVAARAEALRRSAYLLTGSWDSAADLVQGAVLAGYLRRSRLSGPEVFESYVRKVLLSHFLSARRRRWSAERPHAVLPEPPALPDLAAVHADGDAVRRALRGLSPRQRAVVALTYYDDLPQAEIAVMLGCSRASVATHLSRGLAALRDALAPLPEESR